jgi:uncharacterized caspase-like protein
MEGSMLRYLAACLAGAIILIGALAPAAAEKRVALVIGNSAYQHTAPLKNPSNDASDMAAELRELGFDVIDGTDLTKDEMEQRVRTFADKLVGADVGLFFYAGHGLQVDGRNFLAPVDAKLKSDTDLDFEAVELNLVIKQLERNSRISIVFLDACRDNPLATVLAQTSRSLEVGRGLARIDKAVGMMIAFSTQPGNVALDGQGRNSPFTGALLRYIATEGASINDVMIDVRNDVLKATDGKQVPWENSSLTGQFFFKPAAPPTVADESAETAAQIAGLRKEIDRLQADQGARLTAQQEQLEILQHKLASETKTAEQLAAEKDSGAPAPANDRVIAVEPSADTPKQAANVAANPPSPQPESSVAADTKVAAAEARTSAEVKAPEATPASPAPLPEGATRAELAEDIVSKLKELDCYQGRVNGSWGEPAQDALKRFNILAKLDLPVDEPEGATLAALKDWKGPHCTLQAAVPRAKGKKYQAVRPPVNTYKKTVTPRPPYQPRAAARSAPRIHSGGSGGGGEVGAEQQELQRLFPSTHWPGQR